MGKIRTVIQVGGAGQKKATRHPVLIRSPLDLTEQVRSQLDLIHRHRSGPFQEGLGIRFRQAPLRDIIDEAPFFVAAQQFLAKRGQHVPNDVSLVCTDADPAFEWCNPPVSHIRRDSATVVRRIVRWANNVARGKDDRRPSFTKAEFVRGGTIGPARDG